MNSMPSPVRRMGEGARRADEGSCSSKKHGPPRNIDPGGHQRFIFLTLLTSSYTRNISLLNCSKGGDDVDSVSVLWNGLQRPRRKASRSPCPGSFRHDPRTLRSARPRESRWAVRQSGAKTPMDVAEVHVGSRNRRALEFWLFVFILPLPAMATSQAPAFPSIFSTLAPAT